MQKNDIISAIDIGSNTILMLIAKDLGNKIFEILTDKHSIARLGEGLSDTGVINPQAIERAEKILKEYKSICNEYCVMQIRGVATSAIREAKNGKEVAERLSTIIDSDILVISGEEEAKLSFWGTIDSDKMSTVVDIGGGSTEFINGENASINYRKSLNIGAIKITENYFPKHPPTLDQIEKAENFIINNLEQLEISYLGGDLFAVAGTPTTLAAISKGLSEFDYSEIDGVRLSLEFLENIKNDFLSLTIDQIIYKYKIHPKRADVITAGTIILKSVLHFLNRDNFIVSAKGLRYGILKTMLK